MGGLFAVASQDDCVHDLFYGTDYHSHLGTKRGGLAVAGETGYTRYIHDITSAQFRSKFADDVRRMKGRHGIGVISDYEDQPLIIGSHLGVYAIVTVGLVRNADELARRAFGKRNIHFSEMGGGEINPTELVATLINQESSFVEGIANVQECVDGSCSLLLLTEEGIYAARDRYGRTPLVVGRKQRAYAVTLETCALPNLATRWIATSVPGRLCWYLKTASSRRSRRVARCRFARSCGCTTDTRRRVTKGSTSRPSATVAARRWPATTM